MWDMNVLISLGTVLCFLYSLMAADLQLAAMSAFPVRLYL